MRRKKYKIFVPTIQMNQKATLIVQQKEFLVERFLAYMLLCFSLFFDSFPKIEITNVNKT